MIKYPSCKHLRDYNVTWFEHFSRSIRWSWSLQKVSICLAVHSVCPWAFESYASTKIFKTAKEMESVIKAEF